MILKLINFLTEMNVSNPKHLFLKSRKNKRHRSASRSPKSSNPHNVVSSLYTQSSKSNPSQDLSFDTGEESFDLMKIPYATIQPTFDYYLAKDHFSADNISNDLDDSIKQV